MRDVLIAIVSRRSIDSAVWRQESRGLMRSGCRVRVDMAVGGGNVTPFESYPRGAIGEGCGPYFLVTSVSCFRRFGGLQTRCPSYGIGWSRTGFRRPAHGGRHASGARAAEVIMAIEPEDTEFRHPEAVAFLRCLTDEQATKQPPSVLGQHGVAVRC